MSTPSAGSNRTLMKRFLIVFFVTGLFSLQAENLPHFPTPAFLDKPDKARAVTNRAVTMAPSVAIAKNGRLWATWYAGYLPGENASNYVVLSTSGDQGKTWTEVLVADPDGPGPIRSYDPEVWISPNGHLYWIWAQGRQRYKSEIAPTRWDTDLWSLVIENPSEAQPRYSKPFYIAEGVMMCKPITLSNGDWVLPVSHWKSLKNSAQIVVSNDQGKTWQVRGAVHVPEAVRTFDEHMAVERLDGSLWMLVRTKYGIGESTSSDGGRTWSELRASAIPHTSSRFFITRLASGNLLLVRHGKNPETDKIARSHLTAFLSDNDGKTWSHGMQIDARNSISYPDGQQAPDGTIYVTYDHGRTSEREILLAAFTEADILAADRPNGKSMIRRERISQGTGGKEKIQEK